MRNIAELFYARPWAIRDDLLSIMSKVVVRHLNGEKLSQEEIEAATAKDTRLRPGFEISGGVARIPITGIIAKRSSMVNNTSQPKGTSVEQITSELKMALSDKSVKQIVLDVDSPGGSVGGVSELSDLIYASRSKKPITAFADGVMASAAYWIASAAHKVYATNSSEVGSIGVYAAVYDMSVMNHNMGVKTSIIKAGESKASGHPDVPFTEEDRKVLQEEIDAYYELFVGAVARNRGISSDQALKVATGKIWIGRKALETGLIDGIGSIDSSIPSESSGRPEASATGLAVGEEADEVPGNKAGQTKTTEEVNMSDISKLTLEEFRAGRPDLAAALIKEGQEKGFEDGKASAEKETKVLSDKEKARVSAITAKAKEIQGVDQIALECIQSGDSVESSELRMKDAKLKALQGASPAALGGGNVSAETETKDHMARAKEYQAQRGGSAKCSITEALSATAKKTK